MVKINVSSSNLVSVEYDEINKILIIEFKGGNVYEYYEVDETTYKRFVESQSLGSFVQKYLTKNFNYEKIN